MNGELKEERDLNDNDLYYEAINAYHIKWPNADQPSQVISSVDEVYVNLRNNYQLLAKYNYKTKKFVDIDFPDMEED